MTFPRRSTITTRPRTSRADDAASSDAEAPPDTSAATTSACPSACVSTSALTRSRTLRTNGTSIDPIASTSTYASASTSRERRLRTPIPPAR